MKIKIPYQDKITLGYSLARSAGFAAQQLSLPLFEFITTGRRKPSQFEPQRMRAAYTELFNLLKKDSENIAKGIYPVEVLKPEKVAHHFLRYPRIIYDGYAISKRRSDKDARDFSEEAENFLKDLPEYYQRNFHFQTGGYLTRESAELYEHQVEILFSGSADAMRRLIIPLAKEALPGDGTGMHFLEVGAGTGRLTRFMKLAYPKAKITVLDLSYPYLKKAQDNLHEFDRLDFVQGAAEELPFQDGMFDLVYSCFMFHELPHEIRRKVVAEGHRVLRSGGCYGLVDSLQKDDARDFEWALEQFPVDFHEPFYKNYTQNPMEGLLNAAGFTNLRKDQGFFAKALLARKPAE
ncbi:class I SAM-dependent methyltransferase [Bdellovibrio bacteriovorus]|uniref:class I SAM-dependent methyltransferase n=1 Tax=Bdellovibrio bacteriovorus TaxID=959 RepID=UPI0021D200F1|nr:class I SAM-dependent methyltransferase [Bdellovibrio bacteriovorus]UXR63240.1 class I SAM-dependent methyltransferase [Bdellovibrio bacteriovorus]